jgi:N-acetylglucosaminyldiphosphoundecaprenol N-acetyl-beta-D-mannosaminyltransferase
MGINVSGTGMSEVLARVEDFITHSSKLGGRNDKFYVVTPNPELILMAQKDERLKEALNGTELAIPDGIGLKLEIPNLNIIKGRELFSELVALAARKNWKVFLLGGLGRESELAAKKIKETYKDIKIQGDPGWKLDDNAEPSNEIDRRLQKEAIEKIDKFAPKLLFVAFGNPKQEIWVHNNYSKLNIGGAMAVGGAFRYVAGLSKLPPKWMERVDLEWLWRLLTEPHRLGRILRAVIVFPVKVFLSKF